MIYISGKITGTTDYMERFEAVENRLKEQGYKVLNPAKFNASLPQDTKWEVYMRQSIKYLMLADTIYMLKDWEESNGATLELKIAKMLKMEVIYE